MMHACVAGCDISSLWLDLCILTETGPQVRRLGNDAPELEAVVQALRAAGVRTNR